MSDDQGVQLADFQKSEIKTLLLPDSDPAQLVAPGPGNLPLTEVLKSSPTISTKKDLPATISTKKDLPATISTKKDLPATISIKKDLPATISTKKHLPATISTKKNLPDADPQSSTSGLNPTELADVDISYVSNDNDDLDL